jgi:hypothetical protein
MNFSSCIGAVENYVTTLEALREKEIQGENSGYHQNWWFSEFHTPLNATVLFLQVYFKSHPVYDQPRGTHPVFSWLYRYLYLKAQKHKAIQKDLQHLNVLFLLIFFVTTSE